jgi:hypothetical protein
MSSERFASPSSRIGASREMAARSPKRRSWRTLWRHVDPLADLLDRGLAMELLGQALRRPQDLVQGGLDVHRQPDEAAVVLQGPADGLPDPPGGVGGELESPAGVEPLHRLEEPHVPLLDQVLQLDTAARVLVGDAGHEPGVPVDDEGPRPEQIPDGLADLPAALPQDPGLHPVHQGLQGIGTVLQAHDGLPGLLERETGPAQQPGESRAALVQVLEGLPLPLGSQEPEAQDAVEVPR